MCDLLKARTFWSSWFSREGPYFLRPWYQQRRREREKISRNTSFKMTWNRAIIIFLKCFNLRSWREFISTLLNDLNWWFPLRTKLRLSVNNWSTSNSKEPTFLRKKKSLTGTKDRNRNFKSGILYFKMPLGFYIQVRKLVSSVTISGTECTEHRRVSRLAWHLHGPCDVFPWATRALSLVLLNTKNTPVCDRQARTLDGSSLCYM